jgi:N-methylhydantoinase A
MAKILRIVSVERGHDPRDFVLMCFGGAGPMHGCALAEELKITKIIVPHSPGLFSAHGLLAADFRNNLTKAIMKLTDEVDVKKVEAVFQKLELQGANLLEKQRVPKVNMHFIRQMDLRYFGQSYELTIPTSKPFTEEALYQTVKNFHKKHMAIYGYAVKSELVELVNVKLIAVGLVEKPKLKEKPLHGEKPSKDAMITKRKVFFEQNNDYVEASIYRRERLKAGNVINGPAVIEQYDATTVVYPNWMASVDKFGNIALSMKHGGN